MINLQIYRKINDLFSNEFPDFRQLKSYKIEFDKLKLKLKLINLNMSVAYLNVLPFVILNLGGEMIFILDQRLRA